MPPWWKKPGAGKKFGNPFFCAPEVREKFSDQIFILVRYPPWKILAITYGYMLWKYTQFLFKFLWRDWVGILDLCHENTLNLFIIFFFQFSYFLIMIGGIKLFIMSIYTFRNVYIAPIYIKKIIKKNTIVYKNYTLM